MPQRDLSPSARPLWQLSIAGRLVGPVDEAGLRSLAQAGRLSRFSLVQRAGTSEWRLLAAAPELAAILPDLPAYAALSPLRRALTRAEWLALLAIALILGIYWPCRLGWLSGSPFQSHAGNAGGSLATRSSAPALAAETEKALRERRWREGVEAARQYLAADAVPEAIVTERKQAWAALILDQLTPGGQDAPADALPLLKTCLDWAPSSAARAAQRSLAFAQNVLSSGSLQLAQAEACFDFALQADFDQAATSVTQIAWAALAPRLTKLPELGREGFERLFARCVAEDLPETVTASQPWLLAQALHRQAQDDWERAEPLLRDVAGSAADPVLAAVAQKILAPPEPGRREFERPAIVFRTPAKRPALRIELVAAEVTGQEILLELRLSNAAVRRQGLLYAARDSGRRNEESLYLIDDHGRSAPAAAGFGEAGQPLPGREGLRKIELERWGSVKLTARFSMIAPGAARVRFVSSRLPGQGEWGWADLALKAGPFDPPLPVSPLRTAAPPKPEIAPAPAPALKASAATTSTAAVAASAPQQIPTPPVAPEATPTTEPVPSPTLKTAESTRKANGQASAAAAARQAAQKAQEQCRNRLTSGNRALKRNLFDSAEQQRQAAEEAYQARDYAKAELYFKQAANIYKHVPR